MAEKQETGMTNFAKVAEVKAGDWLRADGGFTCMPNDALRKVEETGEHLWVRCEHGRHYLSGSVDDETGTYVGLSKVENPGSGGE